MNDRQTSLGLPFQLKEPPIVEAKPKAALWVTHSTIKSPEQPTNLPANS